MDIKPTKGQYLDVLLRSTKTVFSIKDIVLLWGEQAEAKVLMRLDHYVKVGKLIRVRRGFYVKDTNYNCLELATRIYTPAYVSFETVLIREGINFQYYGNTIFVASYLNREITVGDKTIQYVRMKDYVLSDITGIEQKDHVAIATKERAVLDRLYVSKEYYFDNILSLDWNKIFEIVPIYHNKRLEKMANKYYKYYKTL